MAITAMVQSRIDPNLKSEVKTILNILGMGTTDAINIFFKEFQLSKGIPFEANIPNEETQKAIAEARRKRGKKFNSTKALYKGLVK